MIITVFVCRKLECSNYLVNGWSADDKAAQDDNNRLAVEWFRQTLGRALRQIDEDFILPVCGENLPN